METGVGCVPENHKDADECAHSETTTAGTLWLAESQFSHVIRSIPWPKDQSIMLDGNGPLFSLFKHAQAEDHIVAGLLAYLQSLTYYAWSSWEVEFSSP